jgi:hypothetical protein
MLETSAVPGAPTVRPVKRRNHALVAVLHLEAAQLQIDDIEQVAQGRVGLVQIELTRFPHRGGALELDKGANEVVNLNIEVQAQPREVVTRRGRNVRHPPLGAKPERARDLHAVDRRSRDGDFSLLRKRRLSQARSHKCGKEMQWFHGHGPEGERDLNR